MRARAADQASATAAGSCRKWLDRNSRRRFCAHRPSDGLQERVPYFLSRLIVLAAEDDRALIVDVTALENGEISFAMVEARKPVFNQSICSHHLAF